MNAAIEKKEENFDALEAVAWAGFDLGDLETLGEVPTEKEQEERREQEAIINKTNAMILCEMCEDKGVESFLAEDVSSVFVRFPDNGHWKIAGLNSGRFQAWLVLESLKAQVSEFSKSDIEKALMILGAEAYKKPKRKTWLRVAEHEGKIYIDLCNEEYEAVEISAEFWQVVTDPPVWFMRDDAMCPLPKPQVGGSLDLLREFANMSDDDFMLLIGWLVAAMNPKGPFPILLMTAEQGSGKSTITEMLQDLIDTNSVSKISPPENADELFAAVTSRWLVSIDNLKEKELNALSDGLCRVATGGGRVKRKLYTDGDAYTINVTRPMILNGISLDTSMLDLLDRCYPVQLRPIPEHKRKMSESIRVLFEKVRPQILGALCSAASAVLKEKNYVPLNLPRMADAAAFIMRAEKGGGLGWAEGTFEEVLKRKEAEKNDTSIQNDLVAPAIQQLANDYSTGWSGTLRELLKIIVEKTHMEGRAYLPKNEKGLSSKLDRITPLLRYCGVSVERVKRRSNKLEIQIKQLSKHEEDFEATGGDIITLAL